MQNIEMAELERQREQLRQLACNDDDDDTDMNPEGSGGLRHERSTIGGHKCAHAGQQEQKLWVQQYAPRSYMQLLSAEAVNVKVSLASLITIGQSAFWNAT